MKTKLNYIVATLFLLNSIASFAQADYIDIAEISDSEYQESDDIVTNGSNGFSFETFTTAINSEYSDYGIGFFREKFISFSARKIGALAKIDPITNEPYTKLYCSDITYEYNLKRPQLFSSVLNRNQNLGTLSFSKDGNVIYFTKNKEDKTQSFDLYRAEMNPEREGEWINETRLSLNGTDFSVENPHLSHDGEWLYFASDRPEAIGGFDIFRAQS